MWFKKWTLFGTAIGHDQKTAYHAGTMHTLGSIWYILALFFSPHSWVLAAEPFSHDVGDSYLTLLSKWPLMMVSLWTEGKDTLWGQRRQGSLKTSQRAGVRREGSLETSQRAGVRRKGSLETSQRAGVPPGGIVFCCFPKRGVGCFSSLVLVCGYWVHTYWWEWGFHLQVNYQFNITDSKSGTQTGAVIPKSQGSSI